jgi:hypothetical protein
LQRHQFHSTRARDHHSLHQQPDETEVTHGRLSRRAFTRLALAAPAAGWLPPHAQTGGTTGKLLVGYPAGGTLDTTARQLTEAWRKQGRQYIVDNRAGAAGRIANSQLKREKPDASTLLCTHASALTIYPHVYTRLQYDPVADFLPVSPLVAATCAFAVSSAVPATVRNLEDYVAWVRRSPQAAPMPPLPRARWPTSSASSCPRRAASSCSMSATAARLRRCRT